MHLLGRKVKFLGAITKMLVLLPDSLPCAPRSRGEPEVALSVLAKLAWPASMFAGAEVYSHRCLQINTYNLLTSAPQRTCILLATVVCIRILWCTQILYSWCHLIWWLLTSDKNIIKIPLAI